MMDKITMKNLGFFGYHGVLKEENILGQKFFIDIDMFLDLQKAGISDDVEDTVSYALVYDKVRAIVENKSFKLIEALAEDIANTILREFPKVREININIRKPEAPVNGIYDFFGVEIRRRKNG